ncbi:MAG: retropepsin-like aspartic protease [Candidatus Bipolaricaulota bacterium]|nr:retropepsin-like aspartic protease [Candidatus Bipolaricaulota bacterium]
MSQFVLFGLDWLRGSTPEFLIPAQVNGMRASFLIDTGAALTTLGPRTAVSSGVLLTRRVADVLIEGQETPTYVGWLHELQVNGLKFRGVPVLVLGKQLVLKLLGIPIWSLDGFLGMEPLRHVALTLDYEHGTALFQRTPYMPPSSALSADLKLVEQEWSGIKTVTPIVEGFVEGSGPFPCFIDTGGSAIMGIGDDLIPRLGWQEGRRIRQITLGAIELRDIPAISGKAGGRRLTGIILVGSGVFQAQGFKRVTLDFLAGKLYAER